MSDWTLRSDLELFGIKLPERFSIDDWVSKLRDRPAENTVALVGLASLLFYYAERNHNPKVNSFLDALVYCTTNISVGYCDIFAQTNVGKAVGSALMTIGPSLAAKVLDGGKTPDADVQSEILQTLKGVLDELNSRKTPAPQAGEPTVE